MSTRTLRSERGFSILEVLLVTTITVSLSTIAMFHLGAVLPYMKADAAGRSIVSTLNLARELAQTERRNFQVVFAPPNQLRLIRQEVPTGTTLVRTITLEGHAAYSLTSGLPDTPDGFGNSSEIFFSANPIFFSTDGQLVDNQGIPVNGTVFLNIHGEARSARAVTVFGSTGRVRVFRWMSTQWEM
jgi:Tfp pilus assembly protein FimT